MAYGTQTYEHIERTHVDSMLRELIAQGSVVSGNNPWSVDTKKHGIMLRGEWNEATRILSITVLAADWYVSRTAIWGKIDSLMRVVQSNS